MQIGGGLGEEYMGAPALNIGGGEKGGGSFIASLLDLLGIHRQVAKEPKEPKSKASSQNPAPATPHPAAIAPPGPPAAAPPPNLSVLDDAASAIKPSGSKLGLGFSSLPSSISPENLARYGYVRR